MVYLTDYRTVCPTVYLTVYLIVFLDVYRDIYPDVFLDDGGYTSLDFCQGQSVLLDVYQSSLLSFWLSYQPSL